MSDAVSGRPGTKIGPKNYVGGFTAVRTGDTLVVSKPDRLARSVHAPIKSDLFFKNRPIPTPPSHPIRVLSLAVPTLVKIEPPG